MQHLITTGKLPCTKEECATLAAINLRIYELNYIKLLEEEEKKLQRKHEKRTNSQKSEFLDESRKKSAISSPATPTTEIAEHHHHQTTTIMQLKQQHSKDLDNKIVEEDENVIDESNSTVQQQKHVTTVTETTMTQIKVIAAKKEISVSSTEMENKSSYVGTEVSSTCNASGVNNTGTANNKTANEANGKQDGQNALNNLGTGGNMLVLTNGGFESMIIYLKTCSCLSVSNSYKFITINKLISPSYQRSNDIIKLIKTKKERLAKTSFYSDELKLKEYYVRICHNLNCFGCVLFTVHEILFDLSETAIASGRISFKKVKRLLAIKPNKILLIDYKTKQLAKSQRMYDLKSWYSGDGYYNLTPMFLLGNNNNNNHASSFSSSSPFAPNNTVNNAQYGNNKNGGGSSSSPGNIFSHLFRLGSSNNTIDMNKLFVIEFRNDYKWHMQIDDFHSLKSITCILLDQSLDMGIDNNPLMLDLTISEHFQNRYKLFSSPDHNGNMTSNSVSTEVRNNSVRNHHYAKKNTQHRNNTVSSGKGVSVVQASTASVAVMGMGIPPSETKKSAAALSNHSQTSRGGGTGIVPGSHRNDHNASPSVSFMVAGGPMGPSGKGRNQSMIGMDSETNSEAANNPYGSFSVITKSGNLAPMQSIFSANGLAYGGGRNMAANVVYKYEQEFQELQFILLWFPEEVAFRLTDVEYELFRQVPPMEYLRHATLDMNNFKTASSVSAGNNNNSSTGHTGVDKAKASQSTNLDKLTSELTQNKTDVESNDVHDTESQKSRENNPKSNQAPPSTKSVQDLIVRYKEVCSKILRIKDKKG